MESYKHKYLFIVALGVILFSCSSVDSLEVEHSFTVAKNVELSIEQFDLVEFDPFEDLNLGFYRGNVWIRLEVKNEKIPHSFMIMNNDLINRNYVFYKLDTVDNCLRVVNQIKDSTRQDHRTFNISNPNFKIDLAANERATYLLKTSSDGRSLDATPKLISMTDYSNLTAESMIWSNVFFSFIIFLTLINIRLWSVHRQEIYFYYIFYMLSTFFMYLGLEGKLLNYELKHTVADHAAFLSIRIWVLSLIVFTANFFRIQSVFQGFYKLIKWFLFVVMGGVTLYQFIFYHTSIAYLHYFENLLSFLWLSLILGIVLASAKARRLEFKYYIIPLFCLLAFVTLGLIDSQFQILPGSPFVYIKTGTIIEFLGFTYLMTNLIKRKLELTNNLELELQENKEKLISTSNKLREKDHHQRGKIKKTDILSVFSLLENSLSNESDWNEFKTRLNVLDPDFLNQLFLIHPDLSKSEIRLLTLIHIGYSQKEIANILHIAPDSVKKARSRARKKLNISNTTKLKEYLQRL